MAAELGFKKWERITSLITIDHLFKQGSTVFEFPFKVFYSFNLPSPTKGRLEMAVTVPKKRLKHANDRNYIKRVAREGFRCNNQSLKATLELNEKKLSLFLVYVGASDTEASEIQRKIIVILNRLQQIIQQDDQKEGI